MWFRVALKIGDDDSQFFAQRHYIIDISVLLRKYIQDQCVFWKENILIKCDVLQYFII